MTWLILAYMGPMIMKSFQDQIGRQALLDWRTSVSGRASCISLPEENVIIDGLTPMLRYLQYMLEADISSKCPAVQDYANFLPMFARELESCGVNLEQYGAAELKLWQTAKLGRNLYISRYLYNYWLDDYEGDVSICFATLLTFEFGPTPEDWRLHLVLHDIVDGGCIENFGDWSKLHHHQCLDRGRWSQMAFTGMVGLRRYSQLK